MIWIYKPTTIIFCDLAAGIHTEFEISIIMNPN
jgi:hypothetical protein